MPARDMGLVSSCLWVSSLGNTTGLIYSAGATMCSSVVFCPSISTRMAERNGKNATANNPAVNPPVASFRYPIPYLVGAVAVVIWPLLSDRMHERKWNTALAFLVAASGLAMSTYFPDPVHKMAVLCVCAIGLFEYGATKPARLPIELISAIPPAAAVPLRNAVGNVQNNGAIANRGSR